MLLFGLLPALEASFVEQCLGLGGSFISVSPLSYSPPFVMDTHGNNRFFSPS